MITGLAGLALGLCIGAACRWFDVPLPAPPRLIGALLVVAMTVGLVGTDYVLSHKTEIHSTQQGGSP